MQTNKHKMAEDNEENLIQQMVSKYLPYWPLFLLAIMVGGGHCVYLPALHDPNI